MKAGGKKAEQKLKRILKKQFSNVIDPCPLINSTYWLPLLRHHQYQQYHPPSIASGVVPLQSAAETIITPATTIACPPTQQSSALSALSPTQQQPSICDASETGTAESVLQFYRNHWERCFHVDSVTGSEWGETRFGRKLETGKGGWCCCWQETLFCEQQLASSSSSYFSTDFSSSASICQNHRAFTSKSISYWKRKKRSRSSSPFIPETQ